MINKKFILLSSILLTCLFPALFGQNSPEASNNVRVVTYNIESSDNVDREKEIEKITLLIRQTKPDLVAFQGIENKLLRSGDLDLIKYIATQSGLHMAASKPRDNVETKHKIGILSRYPIIQQVTLKLPNNRDESPKYILGVEVEHPVLGPITFASTEIENDPNPMYSIRQTEAMNNLFDEDFRTKAIIAGSFFAEPKSKTIKALRENWVDASKNYDQFTYPASNPSIKVDYVFFKKSSEWKVMASRVINSIRVNDHLPLVLDLTWEGK